MHVPLLQVLLLSIFLTSNALVRLTLPELGTMHRSSNRDGWSDPTPRLFLPLSLACKITRDNAGRRCETRQPWATPFKAARRARHLSELSARKKQVLLQLAGAHWCISEGQTSLTALYLDHLNYSVLFPLQGILI